MSNFFNLDNLPKEELLDLYRQVARNPSTPPDILAELAHHEDVYVVRNVARNRSTPPQTFFELARHEDAEVIWAVFDNPSSPPRARVIARMSFKEWGTSST